MSNRKAYVRPEIVQLGSAAKLTLGSSGCAKDQLCCDYKPVGEEE